MIYKEEKRRMKLSKLNQLYTTSLIYIGFDKLR